jgi:hypothetical protein
MRRASPFVWVVVAAAALAALFAEGSPTGLDGADAIWRALFAGIVTLCGAVASRWTWIVATAIAAVAAVGGDSIVVAVALVGLVAAVIGALQRERYAVTGALALALGTQALLRLPSTGFSGATALITAGAVLPVVVSGYLNADRVVRRRVRRGALVGGVVIVLILIPVGIAAMITVSESDVAVDESRAWLDAARVGEQSSAIDHLDRSQAAFAEVEQATTQPWLWPARVLPLIGPQLTAVNTMADSGHSITASAGEAARIATPENLRLNDGQIDISLLESLRDPLRDAASELEASERSVQGLNTTWLAPILHTKLDEFEAQILDARDDADLAVGALDVAPDLLGANGPRTYMVLFASPAETREMGGFVGNVAIVSADNGRIDLVEVLRSRALNEESFDIPPERLDEIRSQGFPERYLAYEPWRNWQNITGTPDFPTVSEMVAELAPDAIGRPVDGVLYVDPEGLAGLLKMTGPIQVEGLDQLIGPENVADFLLREQYVLYPETDERADFLEDVATQTFELLTSAELPGPRLIGEALGPAVDGGHFRMWTFAPDEQALFRRLGTTGEWSASPVGDDVLVTVANANPNKIDAYLHRRVTYDGEVVVETGEVRARVTVELANDAPTDLSDYVIGNANGDPPGSNRTFLSLYSGLGIEQATLDGEPLQLETREEYGLRRSSAFVTVPAGGRIVVELELAGRLALDTDPAGYTVRIRTPALVFADQVVARLQSRDASVGVPEVSGPIEPLPPAELGPGQAAFGLTGTATIHFPLR